MWVKLSCFLEKLVTFLKEKICMSPRDLFTYRTEKILVGPVFSMFLLTKNDSLWKLQIPKIEYENNIFLFDIFLKILQLFSHFELLN